MDETRKKELLSQLQQIVAELQNESEETTQKPKEIIIATPTSMEEQEKNLA